MKNINEVRRAVFTETHRVFKARVRRNMISNDSSEFAKLLRQMWRTYMEKYKANKWIEEAKEGAKKGTPNTEPIVNNPNLSREEVNTIGD